MSTQAEIEAFLAKGGTIMKLENGASAYDTEVERVRYKNGRIKRRYKNKATAEALYSTTHLRKQR